MSDISVTEYAARYEETIKDRLKRDDIYEGVLAMFNAKQAEIKRLRDALWLIDNDANSLYDAVNIARAALGEGKE